MGKSSNGSFKEVVISLIVCCQLLTFRSVDLITLVAYAEKVQVGTEPPTQLRIWLKKSPPSGEAGGTRGCTAHSEGIGTVLSNPGPAGGTALLRF